MNSLSQTISAGMILAAFSGCASTSPPDTPSPVPPTEPSAETPASENPTKPKTSPASVTEIDLTRLFTLRTEGKALVYDVRLPLYYKLGHIDGAILFYPKPFDEAFNREEPQMKKALREGKTIVIYCGGADCHDSHIVGKMIAERGIPVSVYPGGWAEWKDLDID